MTLLEAHLDFDRDFRGDTLHPAIMEVMDELGLADDLLQLPHTRLKKLSAPPSGGTVVLADLSHLKTKFPFPYITFMPQAHFLTFLASRTQPFPAFHLRMEARGGRINI